MEEAGSGEAVYRQSSVVMASEGTLHCASGHCAREGRACWAQPVNAPHVQVPTPWRLILYDTMSGSPRGLFCCNMSCAICAPTLLLARPESSRLEMEKALVPRRGTSL